MKHLFQKFCLGLTVALLLTACETPTTSDTSEENGSRTTQESAADEKLPVSEESTSEQGGPANKPTQSQYVEAMKCAASAESNQTLSRQYQQQADIVVNWPDTMWNSVGLMDGSAQLMMYGRAEALDCAK